LLVCSGPALACQKGEAKVFACTTTNNKVVEVCSAGKTATYSFGRRGTKPEMFLRTAKRQLVYATESGTQAETFNLDFPNGPTTYRIEHTHSWGSNGESEEDASIAVKTRGHNVADIACKEGSVLAEFTALGFEPRMGLDP